ncbi:uncharacterized protein C8orf34 homolog isoform X2 [Octodon degus]|uniref:Uncharacterized protein C8orf34 homolog isoform X2 n=1 Tax=Octodon degus TaxID=10160 RepID=A0A6P6F0U7_OCTDE|nr:uncharacterized protein C8orf34 homolog isoform X2 [Octodon degus]
MSSSFALELTELAARRPGFQLSAPQKLAAPGVSVHARGRDRASRARGAQAPGRPSGLSWGPRRVVPGRGARSPGFLHSARCPVCLFMASRQQTRIQAYLERNKIGPLFEELMTKLITETPDQPIPFLIDHLQSKQGNREQLQRTLSGSAALWAESETSDTKGSRRDFRSYDKPWQLNAKKPKKSKSDLAVSSISPPSLDSKSCIAISDELDKETVAFNSSLLRPRVIGEWIGREENDADPLAAEMLQPPVPRSKNDQWESEDSGSSTAGSLKMEPKTKGLKQQQQQHKKLLAAMLSQDSFDSSQSPTPSVTEEDIDNEDDAMELLGNFKN